MWPTYRSRQSSSPTHLTARAWTRLSAVAGLSVLSRGSSRRWAVIVYVANSLCLYGERGRVRGSASMSERARVMSVDQARFSPPFLLGSVRGVCLKRCRARGCGEYLRRPWHSPLLPSPRAHVGAQNPSTGRYDLSLIL